MSVKNSKKKSRTDWEFLADESDEGIDFSDIPELGPDFWQNATSRLPDKKTSITLRLDPDVIAWFRMSGRGYQTRINAVLRSYMQASRKSA